ncbi:MAG: fused MFS/spermidine synthase, partial [Burkholderiales bacterium]
MNRSRVFLAAYTCSGLAGLVYEVTWARLLTLYMGHTTAAASTVTAAFMGGLGLGAALGGRLAPHLSPRQALYAYVLLELVVVLAALAIALALGSLTPILGWAYQDGESSVSFPLVRLLCCLAVLLLPAVALGATFPIAVRWFVGSPAHPGSAAGRLYAANTAGAAVGSLGAGFLLIPTIGLVGSTIAGIAASGLSIAIVLTLARTEQSEAGATHLASQRISTTESKRRGPPRSPRTVQREPALPGQEDRERYRLAAIVLALTGLATFLYEIAWTRVFSMSLGPSTYAFAATLTSFVTGLAAGSFVGAAVAKRARPAFALATTL